MDDTINKAALLVVGIFVALDANSASVYLNQENIDVSVGSGTSLGTFNNTFLNGQTILKVIDAPSAEAAEYHNQTTHVWFTASEIGGGLELVFDFGQIYNISTLHFWNYTGEDYDVDNIDFQFFDSEMDLLGNLSISPSLGTSPGILAEDIELSAPINIQYVTAFLTGSNGEVDFQNMGFTATPVPVPAAIWLFGSALFPLISVLRRNNVSKLKRSGKVNS